MNKQKLFSVLSLLGVVFMIALGAGYFHAMKNRGAVINHQVSVPDQFAGQFSRVISKNRETPMALTSFLSPEGAVIDWSNFKGRYLLVNFWASWCAPCVIELPSLEKLQKKYAGKGLEIIAVSIDLGRTQAEIKEYLYNRNLGEFAAYFDHNREIQDKITMRGIPTSYLLDPKGNIIHIFEGDADWTSPDSLGFFDTLLNQPSG